jgi:hypothetical protein
MAEISASAEMVSEPIGSNFEPVSGAVSEYVAARRLGLSVDTLRRDRRLGQLGIPYVKYGSGKRGRVRYDTADLDRFLETKKRRPLPPVAASQPLTPVEQPEPPAAQFDQLCIEEPPAPSRRSPPRTPWGALAETVQDEPEDDPFAAAGRAAPRRQGSGYWGH